MPLIACVTAYIAVQQWKTNRGQYRLNLFDKRWDVYDSARGLFQDILKHGGIDVVGNNDAPARRFWTVASGAAFLFRKEDASFLRGLQEKIQTLLMLEGQLDTRCPGNLPIGEARSAAAKRKAELVHWFSSLDERYEELTNRFFRYLKAEDI
jgi:hypothetical protein